MIRISTVSAIGAVAALVGACATASQPAPSAPDLTPIVGIPSARAALYADCIAQAASTGRYGRAHDEVHVIVFTCDGLPARTFFDALSDFAATTGSEIAVDDRVIRSTTRIERDLFAADYCERRAATYSCAVSLRTGEFVID